MWRKLLSDHCTKRDRWVCVSSTVFCNLMGTLFVWVQWFWSVKSTCCCGRWGIFRIYEISRNKWAVSEVQIVGQDLCFLPHGSSTVRQYCRATVWFFPIWKMSHPGDNVFHSMLRKISFLYRWKKDMASKVLKSVTSIISHVAWPNTLGLTDLFSRHLWYFSVYLPLHHKVFRWIHLICIRLICNGEVKWPDIAFWSLQMIGEVQMNLVPVVLYH